MKNIESHIPTYIKDTCKIGQGHDCCRYLIMGSKGFECAKVTILKAHLDERVRQESIVARGDNCEGKEGIL
jgi:hypothetical protein